MPEFAYLILHVFRFTPMYSQEKVNQIALAFKSLLTIFKGDAIIFKYYQLFSIGNGYKRFCRSIWDNPVLLYILPTRQLLQQPYFRILRILRKLRILSGNFISPRFLESQPLGLTVWPFMRSRAVWWDALKYTCSLGYPFSSIFMKLIQFRTYFYRCSILVKQCNHKQIPLKIIWSISVTVLTPGPEPGS